MKTFLLLATALNTILAQQNKAECLAMRYTDEQLEAMGDEGCAQAAAQLEAVPEGSPRAAFVRLCPLGRILTN